MPAWDGEQMHEGIGFFPNVSIAKDPKKENPPGKNLKFDRRENRTE